MAPIMRKMPFRFIPIAILTMVALAWSNLAAGEEIHEAAKRGDLAKVKALLKENPALALSRDDTGWTPLHLAAQKGFKEVAELLLANKAQVNAKSKRGDTPLHWAAVNGHKDVAELLFANNADVNARDHGGWTPLHMAALAGYEDMVKLLLANKAQVDAKDNNGITPLSRALAQGHGAVAELLRQAERHSRSASLTEVQAKKIVMQLANDEASKRYHCQPFRDGQPVRFEAGRWTWNAVEGIGHNDVEATVELAADGSTNRVDMQLLDSKNTFHF